MWFRRWNTSIIFLFMLLPQISLAFSSSRQHLIRRSSRFGLLYHQKQPVFRRVARPLAATLEDRDSMSTNPNTNKATPKIRTNAELVAERLQVAREKQQARQYSKQRVLERNQRVKEILQSGDESSSSAYTVPPLYAVKVSVCEELRKELKLSGREKRGRVFLEQSGQAVQMLWALKREMHGFFRALRKDTYILQAGYPALAADGSVVVANNAEGNTDTANFWNIESDEDVVKTFSSALDFFEEHRDDLKRPSIVIHVKRNPNAPKPAPPPAYLDNMANPKDTPSMTMLSFYAFPPGLGIENPDEFATMLRKKWKPFDALGRVYVAQEGVNAQMSVPTNVLSNFMECCQSIPELGKHMENGINIDPVPLSMAEFATAGTPADGGEAAPPFRNLHIRVRGKIVADGLDHGLDWQSAGYDMPPMEWHAALKKAREQQQENSQDAPIILDCRNNYETDVGIFDGAEPLNTEAFRESWDVLKERLSDTPKDAPIMTYCTGGIRCVKVGAYLTQEMGFTNVSRLAGGIIAYDRTLQEEQEKATREATVSQDQVKEPSMFKGTNFVFDGRLGRSITEDALGVCSTCGSETSLVSNCRNGNCHKRIVQCETCKTSFHGTCSDACRNRLVHGGFMRNLDSTGEEQDSAAATATSFSTLDDYSTGHSTPPPSLYRELEFNTRTLIPSGSHMVSGSAQGRLLKQFSSMTRDGRILEIGTFTGYATACLLEGAFNVAEQLGNKNDDQPGPYVMTMERDRKAFEVAVAHMKVVTQHGFGEEAAEALCALRSATPSGVNNEQIVPTIEEDVVSLTLKTENERNVDCDLVRVSDGLAILEEMAAGRGDFVPETPFDMVFVDADKTRLVEYVDACLSSDLILKRGGLITVDNVLWKGLVLEASGGGSQRSDDQASLSSTESLEGEDANEIRKNRRARKLANKMHHFNSIIAKDSRAEVLMLPLRDGLSVIRKK